MQWLIDVLREPAAQLVQVLASAAALVLAARIRGKQRQSADRLEEVEKQLPLPLDTRSSDS